LSDDRRWAVFIRSVKLFAITGAVELGRWRLVRETVVVM
jgi:hypothetical protein